MSDFDTKKEKTNIPIDTIVRIALMIYFPFILYPKIGLIGILLGIILGILPIVGPACLVIFSLWGDKIFG